MAELTSRDRLARWSLAAAAALLVAVAVVHALRYVPLNIAVANSGLKLDHQKAIRALWIAYSLQTAIVAVLLLLAAARPRWISGPALVLTALLPLVAASVVVSSTGSVVAAVMLGTAALLVVAGALLRGPTV